MWVSRNVFGLSFRLIFYLYVVSRLMGWFIVYFIVVFGKGRGVSYVLLVFFGIKLLGDFVDIFFTLFEGYEFSWIDRGSFVLLYIGFR